MVGRCDAIFATCSLYLWRLIVLTLKLVLWFTDNVALILICLVLHAYEYRMLFSVCILPSYKHLSMEGAGSSGHSFTTAYFLFIAIYFYSSILFGVLVIRLFVAFIPKIFFSIMLKRYKPYNFLILEQLTWIVAVLIFSSPLTSYYKYIWLDLSR